MTKGLELLVPMIPVAFVGGICWGWVGRAVRAAQAKTRKKTARGTRFRARVLARVYLVACWLGVLAIAQRLFAPLVHAVPIEALHLGIAVICSLALFGHSEGHGKARAAH